MSKQFLTLAIAFICILSAGALPSWAADPKPAAPFEPLRKIGYAPEETELHDKLVACDKEIRTLIEKFKQDRAPTAKDSARLYVLVHQFRRWTAGLKAYRSTAGVDFDYREKEYSKILLQVMTRFWGTPPAAQLQKKVLQQMARSEQRRLQQLQKIHETLTGGDAPTAEQMIDKLVDDVFSTAGILSPKQKEPISIPIGEVEGPVRTQMLRLRQQRSREALTVEVAKRRGNCEQLVAEIQAAGGAGSVEADGVTLTGPDAVQHFLTRWKMGQVEMLRAIELSRINAAGMVTGGLYSGMGASSEDALTEAEATEFTEAMLQAIGKFVAQDVAQTDPAEAKEKLERYNQVLGQIALLTSSQEWLPKMGATLGPLASQAGLDTEWRAYREATGDLLRWRERAAQAMAAAQDAPKPADLARQKLTTVGRQVGMYTDKFNDLPWIQKPVASLVPDIEKALVGSEVRVAETIALGGNSPMWMSRVDENFYAMLTKGPDAPQQHAALARDLLLSDSDAPLSLEAAAAIASSAAGRFQSAGGEIQGFVVEGATPRFSAMPPVAADLIPYGAAQLEVENLHPASVLALRLDVEPTWFQHRYYFAK